MQRSFSIVQDEDLLDGDGDPENTDDRNFELKSNFSGSDSDQSSPKKISSKLEIKKPEALSRPKLNPGPSSRHTPNLTRKSLNSSDSEDSENDIVQKNIPGEYNPKDFEHLQVDTETLDIFQYIIKYTPQNMNLESKFKPFIPEFLPAVGDIDAFLKVIPPETTLSGETFDETILQLGLVVLDEPASNQSDPALLHLQLRARTDNVIGGNEQTNIVVKKIENIEKSTKVIDKWIKDISHLHKSKSSPLVRYSQPMPDLDDLMQQWPEEMEQKLKQEGFPKPRDEQSLAEYADIVCNFFQIPIEKNKVHSLHLLCCLYAAIRQTQLYQNQSAVSYEIKKQEINEQRSETDQLVLD